MSHYSHEHDQDHGHHHDHDHDLDLAQALSPGSVGRRGFLKFAGFTLAGTALAGCRRPVEKAIPFLVQPEEITPGLAVWYASTCGGCAAGCGVLVKNRDGRPIKLEGNPEHPLSRGGLCAVGQACILELYDSHRLTDPLINGKTSTWTEVDAAVIQQLERIRREGRPVRLLTGTLTSPTARGLISQFLETFSDARHVTYEPLSCSAVYDAHEQTHGRRVLPRYRFEQAEVIVSLDADFLGTWITPVEYAAGYRVRRQVENGQTPRSYHVQIESRMSLTGANADHRMVVPPADYTRTAAALAGALAERAGVQIPARIPADATITKLADRLWHARGKSLVVCGVNDVQTQIWVNFINHLLGNYGETIDLQRPSYQSTGNQRALETLLEEISAGKVAALLVHGVNPVYDLPQGSRLAQALAKIPLVVSLCETHDETSASARFVCPTPHFLEKWDDHEAVAGVLSTTQPIIQRLGRTRTFTESISAWMGRPRSDYELIQSFWKKTLFPRQSRFTAYQGFWDRTVHDGYIQVEAETEPTSATAAFNMAAVPTQVRSREHSNRDAMQLVLYPKVAIRDGRHAHNPWLQELPDPISRISWDNYANLSPATAAKLGLSENDVVKVVALDDASNEHALDLPVHIQPGQHDNVVAIALGYGRSGTERFAEIGPQWLEAKPSVGPHGKVGRHAMSLLSSSMVLIEAMPCLVRIERTSRRQPLAAIQSYHSLDVPEVMAPKGQAQREIVREMSMAAYAKAAAKTPRSRPAPPDSLWPEHRYDGHRWGMIVDLDACNGCSGCVLACQIENNVPVVGKDEMARSREMHWLRIDRYFAERNGRTDVAFQPMLCHHCENAPCETVCPVLATVHSSEGLNQQVYNRCVGTRYCANNCPYKMRRFNWFDYAHQDAMENMILNPDVTVRSRGVMEKCSFCVQRIQAAKIEAKREGRSLKDGEVQPACQQSCPAKAIVFGDMNDPNSEISRLMKSPRYYRVLEELNVRPSVGYLTIINGTNHETGDARHG